MVLPGISTTEIGRIPAVDRPPLSPTDFASVVTAITSAFGDPTRRAIYLFVHEHPDGVTAAAVAERFELHPNVARHHLDKLVSGAYVEVAVSRPPGGGAGRPSKRYRVSAPEIVLELPLRHDDVLVEQLRIVSEHCPFGGAAIEHPVICAVDRGMVQGMLESLYGHDLVAETALSLPTGGRRCETA